MITYVVFAGNFGTGKFHEILGYLRSLADQGAIDESEYIIKTADVWKPEDLDLSFYGDNEVKKVLSGLGFQRNYVALRAKVADRAKLSDAAAKLCERYEIKFGVYDTTENSSEEYIPDKLGKNGEAIKETF